MTDKTKYSNISVSKETYSSLKKLSKELLPGGTPLSISKTVDVLVNEKIQKDYNLLKSSKQQMSEEEALKIIGGDLNFWGVGGNGALKGPPKFNINKKNSRKLILLFLVGEYLLCFLQKFCQKFALVHIVLGVLINFLYSLSSLQFLSSNNLL